MKRCGWCGADTHASQTCALGAPPTPLTGPEALRLLVPVQTAIELVVQGQTVAMRAEVAATRHRLVSAQLKFGAYYSNYEAAFTELEHRAAKLPPAAVAQLRAAAASLRAAEDAFAAASRPIAAGLGFGPEERLPS